MRLAMRRCMYAARAMRWPRCILIVMPHARRAGSQTPPHVTRNRFPPRERPTGALLDAAMSQAPGDRDAGQREKGGTCVHLTFKDDASPDMSVNFADFPLDATLKYMVHHGIEPHYPPRSMIRDPSLADEPEPPVQNPRNEKQTDEVTESAPLTRSATAHTTERHREEGHPHFFDRDEEHTHLAAMATKHYNSLPPPKEIDTIVNFLHRCHRGDSLLKFS